VRTVVEFKVFTRTEPWSTSATAGDCRHYIDRCIVRNIRRLPVNAGDCRRYLDRCIARDIRLLRHDAGAPAPRQPHHTDRSILPRK